MVTKREATDLVVARSVSLRRFRLKKDTLLTETIPLLSC